MSTVQASRASKVAQHSTKDAAAEANPGSPINRYRWPFDDAANSQRTSWKTMGGVTQNLPPDPNRPKMCQRGW